MPPDHVLAIDQGTTSTRAMLFDSDARMVSVAQRELPQHYPQPGWVEHDAEDIWRDTLAVLREAIAGSVVPLDRIAAIGVTNQRETVVVWDRSTGEPIHRAIVWQDRRTADLCASLKAEGTEEEVRAKTGLLLDPYFSSTKLAWILDNVADARARAERGELAFGTIDSFLLWRLTGGKVHATDVTNASRTLLYDIHEQQWDPELCRLFRIPEAILPEVTDNSGILRIHRSRACSSGQCRSAEWRATSRPRSSARPASSREWSSRPTERAASSCSTRARRRCRPPIACSRRQPIRLGGRITYAVEGSIFVAGAAVKWLRDSLGVIASAPETERLARGSHDNHGVYMVPAFVGLGAPHWDANARAAIHGLTLDATSAHLARAALEAVAYQTRDLLKAMEADGCAAPISLRVDGGMAANGWLCQFLADILDCRVDRPANVETTALGAAFLAGLATGVWKNLADVSRTWSAGQSFSPSMKDARRRALVGEWCKALNRTLRYP